MKRTVTDPMAANFKDAAYRAFIRERPCLVCYRRPGIFQVSRTEAAHFGPRGLKQKASDWRTLPLCGGEHHRMGKASAHVLGKNFAAHHGLDIEAEIKRLNAAYEREHGTPT